MPLKHLPEVKAVLGPIEANMDRVIRERFGLPAVFDPAVKDADRRAGWEERHGEGALRLRERAMGASKPVEVCVQSFLAVAIRAGISP